MHNYKNIRIVGTNGLVEIKMRMGANNSGWVIKCRTCERCDIVVADGLRGKRVGVLCARLVEDVFVVIGQGGIRRREDFLFALISTVCVQVNVVNRLLAMSCSWYV